MLAQLHLELDNLPHGVVVNVWKIPNNLEIWGTTLSHILTVMASVSELENL